MVSAQDLPDAPQPRTFDKSFVFWSLANTGAAAFYGASFVHAMPPVDSSRCSDFGGASFNTSRVEMVLLPITVSFGVNALAFVLKHKRNPAWKFPLLASMGVFVFTGTRDFFRCHPPASCNVTPIGPDC